MKFCMVCWNVQLSPANDTGIYAPRRMSISFLNGHRYRSRHVWEWSQCFLLGLRASVTCHTALEVKAGSWIPLVVVAVV